MHGSLYRSMLYKTASLPDTPYLFLLDTMSSLPIYSIRHFLILRHHYPFILYVPCLGNIEIDPGIQTVYFNCKYYYAGTPRMPPRVLARNPVGATKIITFLNRQLDWIKLDSWVSCKYMSLHYSWKVKISAFFRSLSCGYFSLLPALDENYEYCWTRLYFMYLLVMYSWLMYLCIH